MRTIVLTCLALLLAPSALAKDAPRLEPGKVHHLKTKKHDRAWSLFVPSKYSKKKSWPLVISSHGRGGSGKGEMGPWRGLAGKHGFIVACPDMCTATHNRPTKSNLPPSQEDDEVLLEIYETICSQFRVNRRAVMITGFSGGGNPSYHSGLRHPDVFTHICTRGGNWAPQHLPHDDKVLAAGRDHLQIYVFWGEKDHVLIIGNPHGTGQAYKALEALKQAGYKHIKEEQVPAMGHKSRPDLAATWFGEYVSANAKKFKAGDKVDDLLAKARKDIGKKRFSTAVKHVVKAAKEEQKHELRPLSPTVKAELEEHGTTMLDEAKKLKEGGDLKGASRLASKVAREFKGLDVAAEAKAFQATCKP